VTYEIVIPTSGRPSLRALIDAIGGAGDVIVVDDRADQSSPLRLPDAVRVVPGPARGPAAARNAGWRAARAEWVAFLDDDVVPPHGWRQALIRDLEAAGEAGATQGSIVVPVGPRPTDWERNVAGLEDARWATADMAYRRDVLTAVCGFDERFPRAYREDADLGLRVERAGWTIVRGARHVVHPVGAAPASISLKKQAGNADDVLMRRLHGPDWRERAGVPRGRRPRHLAVAAAGAGALVTAAFKGHRRRAGRPARLVRLAALGFGGFWLAGTAELAWARIKPGPRTLREITTMAWTSAALPFCATGWWLRGCFGAPRGVALRPRPRAVLFDRDDTLIVDVPYNGDPERVVPVPGAREALERLRAAGVPVGVVSNQSGIARGLLTAADVVAVHDRMEALIGPLGPLEFCPHGPGDGCACRKPAPGLVERAAARLGVSPRDCAVIGDIGADVEAALAAGARPVLVPTARTRPEEVAAAPERARDLAEALDLLGLAPAPAAVGSTHAAGSPAPDRLAERGASP
jgi:HAD superfamily hydrolase (TIGR01662 family)